MCYYNNIFANNVFMCHILTQQAHRGRPLYSWQGYGTRHMYSWQGYGTRHTRTTSTRYSYGTTCTCHKRLPALPHMRAVALCWRALQERGQRVHGRCSRARGLALQALRLGVAGSEGGHHGGDNARYVVTAALSGWRRRCGRESAIRASAARRRAL